MLHSQHGQECSQRTDALVFTLQTGHRPRRECREEYPEESLRPYRRAYGNGYASERMKRFWTSGRYSQSAMKVSKPDG